jgi:predicted DNA-binding antitoxin AbrB/MazE fold protein
MNSIEAIFENGVFRPIDAVSLPDKQRVRIEVRPVTDFDDDAWLLRVKQRQAGIMARVGFLPDSTIDIAADRRRDG